MSERPRKPQAFRLGAEAAGSLAEAEPRRVSARSGPPLDALLELDEPPAARPDVQAIARTPARVRWGRLLLGAVGGLLSLAFGLWVDALVRELFARADWLGYVGLALLAIALLALAAIVIREIAGMLRLARIDALRAAVAVATAKDDEPAARRLAQDLSTLYADRPETAGGRAALALHMREVVEGRDLLILAERELLAPLDAAATALVLESAKRVSVVTAISPRAVVDLLFVLVENLRLMRRLCDLYGGRPGPLGFIGFAGRVVSHLGVTGGMAVGDSLLGELVGQGLAARLSARLGEGVVNGLMTARIGLAALDLVRPMPHLGLRRPAMGDVIGELTKFSGAGNK